MPTRCEKKSQSQSHRVNSSSLLSYPIIPLGCFSADTLLPAATKLGQGNIFTSVCQEFCPRGGGGCLPQCMLGYNPPGADTPPGSRLKHTVYERPVRILLECILVFTIKIQTSEMLSYVYLSGAALTDTVASSLYTKNSILVFRYEPYVYCVD